MNLNTNLLIILLQLGLIKLCYGSRILGIFPIPFREHQQTYQPLIQSLADHGHELVILTTDPIEYENKNIEQIDLSFTYNLKILEQIKDTSLSGSEMLKTIFNLMRKITDAQLNSNQVKNLLESTEEKFDAVIVEWSGVGVMNAFAYKYKVPLIGIATGGAFINAHQAFGNPIHPVAYPSVLLPFSEDLNWVQRIASVVFTVWYRYTYFTQELPQQNLIAQQHFGSAIPDLWSIESSADLLLINSYQALGNVRPIVPTTVHLGGIHARKIKELPEEISNFLNFSSNGVIYINFESSKSGCISSMRLQTILYAIEKLKMDIIWNCEETPSLIKNSSIKILNSPDSYQEDILAHSNVVIFITTGGQRNIEDAIHHSVPVLGISFSSYIEHYLRQLQKHDAAIISLIDFETNNQFTEKLRDVVENVVYKNNIKNLNRLLADQPQSPIDRAIWWIEYTIRNNGTKLYQSPMRHITWFQYLMLDVVITIIILVIILVCFCAYLIQRMIKYSKSLPIELVTRGSKCKVL